VKNSTSNAGEIAPGSEHSCFTTIDKKLYCTGSNDFGELGDGQDTLMNNVGFGSPVEMGGVAGTAESVVAGLNHSCVILTGGGVKCWGRNDSGQLGNSTTSDSPSPVNVTGLTTGVSMLATGRSHTCALITATGGIKCWGQNTSGQLGNSSTTNSSAPVDVTGLTSGVSKISAGGTSTCALLSSGGLKCWGRNANGQLGDNSTTDRNSPVDVNGLTTGVADISVGRFHACASTTAGAAKCWGSNFSCALGNNDGTCNSNYSTPQNVFNIAAGVAKIASGDSHSCALMSNSAIRCWGSNSHGQLGKGTLGLNYFSYWEFNAADAPNLSAADLYLGGSSSCLITSGNSGYCWGDNTYGQRGDGMAESQLNSTSAFNADLF
jgi:alpha-tubulin suppressor-like RCC1 family protein